MRGVTTNTEIRRRLSNKTRPENRTKPINPFRVKREIATALTNKPTLNQTGKVFPKNEEERNANFSLAS